MSSGTMKAALLYRPDDLRVEEIPIPTPDENEVLIKVDRCGICGTDAHILHGRFPAPNLPLVIGHEFAGTVVHTGSRVEQVKLGQKVTVDINISCGVCYFCRINRKLFCPYVRQLGVHAAGGMAEYVVAPAANVYVLPDSMSFEHAAYIEPLACTIHGQDRAQIAVGDSVAIIGAGPMGLAHTLLAKARGVAQVIISEPDAGRRKRAVELGADSVINPMEEDPIEAVRNATGGRGADVVIEAVGSPRTYEQTFGLVRRGGTILAYGAAPPDATIQARPFNIYANELTIVGSYAGTYETWPKAIALIESGRFDPSAIVDSVRPLVEVEQAIESIERDKSVVKVQVAIAAIMS